MSSTTYIQKSAPIKVRDNSGDPIFVPFDDVVKYWLNNDVRFNSDAIGIKMSIRIEAALEKDVEVLAIPTEPEYKTLLEVVSKPDCRGANPYPIAPARMCESVIQAVKEGTTEKPKAKRAPKADEPKAPEAPLEESSARSRRRARSEVAGES